MKAPLYSALVAGIVFATSSFGAAPAGSMGMCKDGTFSTAADKKGACRGHQGVKDWYENALETKPAVSERAPTPPPSTATTAPITKAGTAAVAVEPPEHLLSRQPSVAAGKVWANTSTKVYHCQGAKYYGTTKHGEYMSEDGAKQKGYHADHGKACA